MRVHVVDPAAYTPPYDRALCAALSARADVEVTLVSSAFRHGDVPPVTSGYALDERFYTGRGHRAVRHVADMLAYRRTAAKTADVVHFQWAPVQEIDWALMPDRPLVITAHDVLPREARPLQRAGQRRIYRRADAIVVHSQHGRARLIAETGVPEDKITVIEHGAFTHLAELDGVAPPELAGAVPGPPAALFFGLLRPYKGLDVLYEAWRGLGDIDAQLWVVGSPRMPLPEPPPGVRVVTRFVSDAEAAWCLREAALVVLPYREIDQSGVLFSALGLGRPLLLSDAGGFPELGEVVAHVPVGDAAALAAGLRSLLTDEPARAVIAAAASKAAATRYSWAASAASHAALYARLAA